jgi:hypothetical protein
MGLRSVAVLACVGLALGACVSTESMVAQARKDFIGKPISNRYEILGQPETVVRVSPTEIAHTWAKSETNVSGGGGTIIPYAGGATVIRNSSSVSSSTCRATYIARATSDATPLYQQIITDVRSPGCN